MSKEDSELRTALEAMVRDIKANGKRTTIEELFEEEGEDVDLYKSIATLVELGKAIEEQHPNFFDGDDLERVIHLVRTNKEFSDYVKNRSYEELMSDLYYLLIKK